MVGVLFCCTAVPERGYTVSIPCEYLVHPLHNPPYTGGKTARGAYRIHAKRGAYRRRKTGQLGRSSGRLSLCLSSVIAAHDSRVASAKKCSCKQ